MDLRGFGQSQIIPFHKQRQAVSKILESPQYCWRHNTASTSASPKKKGRSKHSTIFSTLIIALPMPRILVVLLQRLNTAVRLVTGHSLGR